MSDKVTVYRRLSRILRQEKGYVMKKNRYVTKMNLYIRILVAGYVVYLAYELVPSVQAATGNEKIWMILATAVLALAGLAIVIFSVKGLIRREYYDADEIAEMEAAKEDSQTDAEQAVEELPEQEKAEELPEPKAETAEEAQDTAAKPENTPE